MEKHHRCDRIEWLDKCFSIQSFFIVFNQMFLLNFSWIFHKFLRLPFNYNSTFSLFRIIVMNHGLMMVLYISEKHFRTNTSWAKQLQQRLISSELLRQLLFYWIWSVYGIWPTPIKGIPFASIPRAQKRAQFSHVFSGEKNNSNFRFGLNAWYSDGWQTAGLDSNSKDSESRIWKIDVLFKIHTKSSSSKRENILAIKLTKNFIDSQVKINWWFFVRAWLILWPLKRD